MGYRIGPYEFDRASYDPADILTFLMNDARDLVGDFHTPEGHVWLTSGRYDG